MNRRTPLRAKKVLERHTPVKKSNPARKKREWKRSYGSKDRVIWIKSRPCDACKAVATEQYPNENAHLPSRSGMGRKGDAKMVCTLCDRCHFEVDNGRGLAYVEGRYQVDLYEAAARIDREWTEKILQLDLSV